MADAIVQHYGALISAGSTAISDNSATALDIESTDGKDYIKVSTVDGSEALILCEDAGKVGIGVAPTLCAAKGLHIQTGDTAAASHTNADELVLEASGNCGMGIAMGASSVGSIYFSIPDIADSGSIRYTADTTSMSFHTGGATARMTIDSAGKVSIKDASANACLDVAGDAATALTSTIDSIAGNVLTGNAGSQFETDLSLGSVVTWTNTAGGIETHRVDVITNDTTITLSGTPGSTTDGTQAYTDGNIFQVQTGQGTDYQRFYVDTHGPRVKNGPLYLNPRTSDSNGVLNVAVSGDTYLWRAAAAGGIDYELKLDNGRVNEICQAHTSARGASNAAKSVIGVIDADGNVAKWFYNTNGHAACRATLTGTGSYGVNTTQPSRPSASGDYINSLAVYGNNVAGTGTILCNGDPSPSATMTISSGFDGQLKADDDIYIGGGTRRKVLAVVSDTEITVDETFSSDISDSFTISPLRFVVTSSGNVGINCAAPSAALQIQTRDAGGSLNSLEVWGGSAGTAQGILGLAVRCNGVIKVGTGFPTSSAGLQNGEIYADGSGDGATLKIKVV